MNTPSKNSEPAPYDILVALKAMMDTPGWAYVCAEAERKLTSLTTQMHDLKTPPNEAESMRQARGRITIDFMPAAIADSMVKKLGGSELLKRT